MAKYERRIQYKYYRLSRDIYMGKQGDVFKVDWDAYDTVNGWNLTRKTFFAPPCTCDEMSALVEITAEEAFRLTGAA
jgi:hypothetical protein